MEDYEIVKAADAAVLARCLAVREAVFTREKGVPREIEADGYDVPDGKCEHFLIRFRGEDAGAVRCRPVPPDTVLVQRFCIGKEYRGRGFGRALADFLADRYRGMGFAALEVEAKCEARGFYEKCGFTAVSGVFIEAGVEHIKMKRSLVP